MKRILAKIFPKLLNFEQKQHRMDIAQEMLRFAQKDQAKLQSKVQSS